MRSGSSYETVQHAATKSVCENHQRFITVSCDRYKVLNHPVMGTQTNRQSERQSDRHSDRQSDRQTDSQTDRQTDRQAHRQAEQT